ncbi:hypothetical protein J2W17_003612 [Pseudomonas lini]|uniref:hypothetical protein n=1 Tax=Pseudomonas lini TaxID=163011 RepID=UPI002789F48D|nr:hypothetical protein [Pseudomonas lini]MDQ0124658.1 hypothetical protein [Pseudomonas lini]
MSAYVSTELSMIQMLDPLRHELAMLQDVFILKGGAIQELPSCGIAHRPPNYNRSMTPNFQGEAAKVDSGELVVRIRAMAKTLNRSEICEKEGISLGVLRGIGRRYSIEFKVGPKKAFAPNKATAASEALLVIRVKDCVAKGINRSQCAKTLSISSTLLLRLIKDYAIDYPKMKPAFR